jgi:hypothetical protein
MYRSQIAIVAQSKNYHFEVITETELKTIEYIRQYWHLAGYVLTQNCTRTFGYTVRSESRCALRLRYVDLVVSIEVAVEACCCFTVFSC